MTAHQCVEIYVHEHVRAVADLHSDLITKFRGGRWSVVEFLEAQADRVLEAHGEGRVAVVPHFKSWCPRLVSRSTDEILATAVDLAEVRLTIAREFGFSEWESIATRGQCMPDLEFETAVDTMLRGDAAALSQQLEHNPGLVNRRSSFGHEAALLHYLAANGVETFRQQVPLNAAALAECLLASAADPNAVANMYGGATPLVLLLTSAHPAQAGITESVARVLRSAAQA